jgi:hypothetical protein
MLASTGLSTLDYWCQKLCPSGKKNNGKTDWIPLRIDERQSACVIDLQIGRITIVVKPGFDPGHLTELLRTVGTIY